MGAPAVLLQPTGAALENASVGFWKMLFDYVQMWIDDVNRVNGVKTNIMMYFNLLQLFANPDMAMNVSAQ